MDEMISNAPSWLKWTGASGGAIVAGFLFLRQFLSSAKVDRTANEANVATILRQQDEIKAANERADQLMHEREAMATEIGSLRAEVKGLREQIELLTSLVHELRAQK